MLNPKQFFNDMRTAASTKDEIDGSRNLMLSDVFLSNIANYSFMHCSQSIVDAIIQGSRIGLPAIKTYLESRIDTTDHPLIGLS